MACVITSVTPLITDSITPLLVSDCESWDDLQSKKKMKVQRQTAFYLGCVQSSGAVLMVLVKARYHPFGLEPSGWIY